MALRYHPDPSPADWLAASGAPAGQLIVFGPAGFDAYARLRFIPDPTAPGQLETDATVPDDHPSDLAQVGRALRLLAAFTATPEVCWFCLWEGYADAPLPPAVRQGPLVELPHRRYALLRGDLSDIDAWAARLGDGQNIAPPAFVWPADHAWCVAADVDPHWAGVAASRAAVDALVADPQLDVVAADPGVDQPRYR